MSVYPRAGGVPQASLLGEDLLFEVIQGFKFRMFKEFWNRYIQGFNHFVGCMRSLICSQIVFDNTCIDKLL